MRYKFKTCIIIFLCILLNMFLSVPIHASSDKNILVIGSYNSNDPWETSIINGLKHKLDINTDMKVEFLDSKSPSFNLNDKNFMNYLDSKYKDENINYIITLDDPALCLARNYLFNKDSFFYKKNILFAGVNDIIKLSKKEKEYINGLFNYNNVDNLFNTILKQHPKIKNIYLISNNNSYGNSIANTYYDKSNSFIRPFNLKVINGIYFEDIKDTISNIPTKDSAICLSATLKKDKESLGSEMSASDIISNIKNLTTIPIYTTIMDYVDAGAIGGIVNDGYKIGISLGNLIENETEHILGATLDNSFNTYYFNFNEVRRHNLNPWLLPKNTTYINKKPYNILAPKKYILFFYLLIISLIIIITYTIFELIKKRKESKEKSILLIESLEREKIRTDFVISLSHELRTPLNIIKNAASIIKLKIENDDINKDYSLEKLDNIIKNSNRLQRYINNLIDVSRFEMNQISLDFTIENIVAIVEDTVSSTVDLAQNHNIEIIFDTSYEEIIMDVDVNKLQRIILNILSNSIKFSKEKGSIIIYIDKISNYVVLTFKDDGIGIPEEALNHIFDKFKRVDYNTQLIRQQEGSGLGLYIVKNLVDLMNGTIEIESILNVGTKITILLPITKNSTTEKFNSFCDSITNLEMSDIENKK